MKYLYLARKKRGTKVAVVNPYPRAGARALLGAVERRERDVRHEDDRRVLLGAHRRRHRVRQRRAEGRCSRPAASTALHRRAHRRASTSCSRSSTTSRSTSWSGCPARRAPTWSGSPRMYAAGELARSSSGRWASPSTRSASRTSQAIVNLGAGPRQRRPSGRRPDADPRPLRRAGRRRDGRATPPRSRAGSPIDAGVGGRARARSGASTVPRRARPHRGGDGRGRAPRASSTSSGRAAATSSTCCPTPS